MSSQPRFTLSAQHESVVASVDFLQAVDGCLDSGRSGGSKLPSPSGDLLSTGLSLALEDAAGRSPDAVLAAEHAVVL